MRKCTKSYGECFPDLYGETGKCDALERSGGGQTTGGGGADVRRIICYSFSRFKSNLSPNKQPFHINRAAMEQITITLTKG